MVSFWVLWCCEVLFMEVWQMQSCVVAPPCRLFVHEVWVTKPPAKRTESLMDKLDQLLEDTEADIILRFDGVSTLPENLPFWLCRYQGGMLDGRRLLIRGHVPGLVRKMLESA